MMLGGGDTGGVVRDALCDSCGFRISDGVYAYMAGSFIFCQRCVHGPYPYGHEPTRFSWSDPGGVEGAVFAARALDTHLAST